MDDSALKILSQINIYSVSLITIVCIFIFSFLPLSSKESRKRVNDYLLMFMIIWLIFFGYKVITGNGIFSLITAPSQRQIEAAKYEKYNIDGRDIYLNKETGEIVKKIPER